MNDQIIHLLDYPWAAFLLALPLVLLIVWYCVVRYKRASKLMDWAIKQCREWPRED